jgi:hypothetical protein
MGMHRERPAGGNPSLAEARFTAMHLIYVDESGNTGANLDDAEQPVYFLAAVFVSEDAWMGCHQYWRNQVLGLTRELAHGRGIECPPELHAADVYHGTRCFRGIARPDRERIIRAVLSTLQHPLDVVYAACHKKQLGLHEWDDQVEGARWFVERFLWYPEHIWAPDGSLYPELPGALAWSLLLPACNAHLARLAKEGPAHGLVIADRSTLQDFARRTVRATELISLADHAGPLSEDEIVEDQVFVNLLDTVHFVDSHESPCIQLADFVAYFIMRAWRAGNWERPGPEPHYDEFVRPAVRGAYHYPQENNDG